LCAGQLGRNGGREGETEELREGGRQTVIYRKTDKYEERKRGRKGDSEGTGEREGGRE